MMWPRLSLLLAVAVVLLLVARQTCDKATGMLPAPAAKATAPSPATASRQRQGRKYRMSPDVELCALLSCDFGHGYDSGGCTSSMPLSLDSRLSTLPHPTAPYLATSRSCLPCLQTRPNPTCVAFVQSRCQLNVNRICDYNNLLATVEAPFLLSHTLCHALC